MNTTPIEKVVTGPDGAPFTIVGGNELPHSIEAENMLLAGVLADDTGAAWAVALNCGVRPKAFYQPAAQIVWELLTELRKAGQPGVDVVLLAEELKMRDKLEQVGGFAWLSQITQALRTSASVRYYAETVVLLWERRHAVVLAGKLRETAMEFESRETFANKSAQIGQKLIGLGRKTAKQTMHDEIQDSKEHVLSIAEGRFDMSRVIRTGIPMFDEKCSQFGMGGRDDKLIMIAAGSGHGKSVALRQIARVTLEDGKRVLFYSREQSVGDLVLLMASAAVGYDLAYAATQPKDRTEVFAKEVDRMQEEWAEKRLFAYSHSEATPLITIEDLCEHARAWAHLHGPPDLIVVDYLQMFDTRKRFQNTEARVGYVAYALQALQRELDRVMVVGVQVNEAGLSETRKATYDDNGKLIHHMPHRGWVRDSQQIYMAADRMIFLYVPPEDMAGGSQLDSGLTRLEVWWHQEKRRKGLTDAVKTTFEKSFVRFIPHGRKAPIPEGTARGEPLQGSAAPLPKGAKVAKDKYLKPGVDY